VRSAKDVGALRHEVHAAEDDELRFTARRGGPRELEGIAGVVGELDHFVALIVMAENDDAIAEFFLGCGNALVHLII